MQAVEAGAEAAAASVARRVTERMRQDLEAGDSRHDCGLLQSTESTVYRAIDAVPVQWHSTVHPSACKAMTTTARNGN